MFTRRAINIYFINITSKRLISKLNMRGFKILNISPKTLEYSNDGSFEFGPYVSDVYHYCNGHDNISDFNKKIFD